tara:strand:- start:287 stop:1078 length:792 start_codon:yes stop_codon:yes gene_type:complete
MVKMEKGENMISIKNIVKQYGKDDQIVNALNDVTLNIDKGEIYGVIGLSGAGKSTLIRTLNRLEEVDSGQVVIDGEDMKTLSPKALRDRRKKIGMIFQHFHLLSSRTVSENIAFPLEIAGWKKDEIKSRVAELLDLVGLPEKADVYPNQLSGGQKQRVAIARALANKPKLLLSDESTSALDPITTRSILSLLQRINQDLGVTIVLITHEMEVIKQICTKVAVMDDGKVIEKGSVASVLKNPKSSVTKAFLGDSTKAVKLYDAS